MYLHIIQIPIHIARKRSSYSQLPNNPPNPAHQTQHIKPRAHQTQSTSNPEHIKTTPHQTHSTSNPEHIKPRAHQTQSTSNPEHIKPRAHQTLHHHPPNSKPHPNPPSPPAQ